MLTAFGMIDREKVCVEVQKRNGRMRTQGLTGNSCKSWEDFGL